METEQDINKSNEEVKNIEEQHEKVRKAGAVAAAVLSAFLNTAPVAAASYTPPTEPSETPELIVPKTGAEQPITGDIALRPGMTPPQIEAMAKEAVKRYEMEQDFKGVLQECTDTAQKTGNMEQGTQKCVEWYKQQEAKGFGTQALKTMQHSLEQSEMSLKTEGNPETGYTEVLIMATALQAIIIAALVFKESGKDKKD